MELVMDYRKAWHNIKDNIKAEMKRSPDWKYVDNLKTVLRWMEMAEEGQEL